MNVLAMEAPRLGGMTADRVDWHLWNWAQWMHGGKSDHLRAKIAKCWSENGDRTSDEMLVPIDKRCAAATDSSVDALPQTERAAVYAMRLQGKWSLGATALAVCYRSACEQVGRNLGRRGIV